MYARSRVPVTLVRTSAWFTLAQMFLGIGRVGPLRVVPSMGLQPVHPDAVADLLAEVALGEPPAVRRLVQLAGSEMMTSGAMARALAREDGIPGRLVTVPLPGLMRTALLPGEHVTTDARRFDDWLHDPRRPRT